MRQLNWKAISEGVGVAAIVGSLVFVGLQMRQAEQLASAELAVSLAGPSQELIATITEHAGIWRRGNAGEPLDPDDRVIYEELIRAKWSMAFWEAYSYQQLGSTLNIAAHSFAMFLFDNPGARRTWQTEQDGKLERFRDLGVKFPSGMVDLVRKDLEVMDARAAGSAP